MAERSREQHAAVAEIGEIPPPANPRRRKKCEHDLLKFLTTYFPQTTGLCPFSEDHKRVIARMQHCFENGGRILNAVYRGFAKTTISENSVLWAVLYGKKKFVFMLAATREDAGAIIDSVKSELESNPLLAEDFPEVCRPIEALEGKPQRCASQTCGGELTHMQWTSEVVVLPTIAGSAAAGAIIQTKGLTGATRGKKFKRQDGTNQRPDFVLIDDPQTDKLARSPDQVTKQLGTIHKGVLKGGGHRESTACVCNATVIEPDDAIDQLLDPMKHPAWQGERIPMVKKWADAHETLWLEKYATIRNTFDRSDPEDQRRAHKKATAYYKKNRKKMDAGCVVSWKHCYNPDTELSAIQHAYNALIDDGPVVFASEYQNQPIPPETDGDDLPSVEVIAEKFNRLKRRLVPIDASRVTVFIDVQKKLLPWVVVAWAEGFTGYVIDYGTWPDQKRTRWSLADARITLGHKFPKAGLEGSIYAGLEAATEELLGVPYLRDDGAELQVDRCLIDANWGMSTDVVYQFCRSSQFAATLLPSHGKGITASNIPMAEYKRKKGERLGHNWRIPAVTGKRQVRHVLYDTNYWKSFVFARLAVSLGDPGCLSLFGRSPHRLFAEQMHAEFPVKTEGRGRTVYEWKQKPNHPDNHYLDGLVGCAVAASMCGVTLMGEQSGGAVANRSEKKPRRSLAEMRAEKRKR